MDTDPVVQDEWPCVLAILPSDVDETAAAMGALQRRRQIKSAGDLLRVALHYALCDLSLAQTAVWASMAGIAQLSAVALYKRLCNAEAWLGHLVFQLLQRRAGLRQVPTVPVLLLDATVISGPRSKGTDWRVHLAMDLQHQRISSVELTGPEGGETFARHQFSEGQIVLADRGYGHRNGVAGLLGQGAHVVVRIASSNFPLETPDGEKVAIPDIFEGLQVLQVGDWPVQFRTSEGVWPMRLVALRKTQAAAQIEQDRLGHEAKRKSRQPDERSLRAAHYVILLTDLPASQLSAEQVAELYRLRWQVEICFKRLKGILQLDHLRAQKPRLARAYLYAKLIAALIIDQMHEDAVSFSPWGYAIAAGPTQPMESNPTAPQGT